MSRFMEMVGDVTTSIDALPLIVDTLGIHAGRKAEWHVRVNRDKDKKSLRLTFRGSIRDLNHVVHGLLDLIGQRHPHETMGGFSTHGSLGCASTCFVDGKLFKRSIDKAPLEEVTVSGNEGGEP